MTAVPVERVVKGHLMLEHEGALMDLGPCTLEDIRLIAFVAQEAYIRLPSKRGRSKSTPKTLGRVRNITRQMWKASEDPDNRRRRVPGRTPEWLEQARIVHGADEGREPDSERSVDEGVHETSSDSPERTSLTNE